jgi:hypothetical protein
MEPRKLAGEENGAGLVTSNPTLRHAPSWSLVLDNFSFGTNCRGSPNVNKLYSGDRAPGGFEPSVFIVMTASKLRRLQDDC